MIEREMLERPRRAEHPNGDGVEQIGDAKGIPSHG